MCGAAVDDVNKKRGANEPNASKMGQTQTRWREIGVKDVLPKVAVVSTAEWAIEVM